MNYKCYCDYRVTFVCIIDDILYDGILKMDEIIIMNNRNLIQTLKTLM